MKLAELFETFDKSHTLHVRWIDHGRGSFGRFAFEDKQFGIDVQNETAEDLEREYKLSSKFGISKDVFENKVIVRIDFCQLIDGQPVTTDTDNMGHNALKVLSTIAIEAIKKIGDKKIDFIYFAAKNHDDGTDNKRKTLYPTIGRLMSKRLGMKNLTFGHGGSVIVLMVNYAMDFDELGEILTAIK